MPASASSRCTSPSSKAATVLDLEAGERGAEVLALAQNRQPRQTRLEAFEAKLLEQTHVVGDRMAPFVVVVLHIERIVAAPPAPSDPINAYPQAICTHRAKLP